MEYVHYIQQRNVNTKNVMGKISLILLTLTLLLSSCIKANDFKVKSLDNITLGSQERGSVTITVATTIENRASKVSIKELDASFFNGLAPAPFAEISLVDDIFIPHGTNRIEFSLDVSIKGGVVGALAAGSLLKNNLDRVTASGKIKVKKGFLKKNITLERAPIKNHINSTSIDVQQFL